MKKHITIILTSSILFASLANANSNIIKKTKSGTCHGIDSPYYKRIKKHTPYNNMDECVRNNGKEYQGRKKKNIDNPSIEASYVDKKYNRKHFKHWIDTNSDCINTRHEVFKKLSTGNINYDSKGCKVVHGKWYDPYTDKNYSNPKKLDIDHVVPLKWAWEHGANLWDNEKRQDFANNEINLLAVDLRANRQKGAKGILEWLPENKSYQCRYILKFTRIVKKYKLTLSEEEKRQFSDIRKEKCKKR